MNVPEAVGVPEIVMVLFDQVALTPAGKPFAPETPALLMPVAPVVVRVIFVSRVLIQSDGVEEEAFTVLMAFTTMVPVAFTDPQPPVSGME